MKRILLKISLFFSLMAFPFATLFILPYPEEFAYRYIENDCYNHGSWIYDRICKNNTTIDIAFIGSSHTIHAFQEKKLEELSGLNLKITNLGYCRFGRNLEYAILKLLLKHKSPKLIVIEVHEDEEKNSHDIFPYLAETKDLLQPPTPFNRDYFSDVYKGGSARLEHFKSKYIFGKKYSEPSVEIYGYGASDRLATDDELKENEKAWQQRLNQATSKTFEKIQMKYPLAYLKSMIALIKGKNIPYVFVYLPEFGSKLRNPKHALHYQSIEPLLIPPQFILDDPSNWMDATHFNDKGSGLLSEWMAEQLKNEFCTNFKSYK